MNYQDEFDQFTCSTCKDTCECRTCKGRGYTYVAFVRVTCSACKGTRLCPVCCDVNAAYRAMKEDMKYADN